MSVTYFRSWLSENFDQSFPCILASIKTGDRPWRLFYALHEVLGIVQTSITNPLGKSRDGLFEPIYVVEDNESLHACALHQQMTLGAWSVGPAIPGCDRSGSANDDAAADGQMAKNRVADRTTGIVEIEIDAFGSGRKAPGPDNVALVHVRPARTEALQA